MFCEMTEILKNFQLKKKKESSFYIEIIKSELGHEGKALIQWLVSFILLLFWKIFIYLAAPGLRCHTQGLQLQHVGSSSLIRGQIQAPCIGILKSSPLVHQGSPWCQLKKENLEIDTGIQGECSVNMKTTLYKPRRETSEGTNPSKSQVSWL